MTSGTFTLDHITLATTHTAAMVTFYNRVFEANLVPVSAYSSTLHRGSLAGIELLLCPNEIAGVQAEQNRHQLRFRVPNLAQVLARVQAAGGTIDVDQSGDQTARAAVRDPDGNTLEFVQAV